MDRDALIREVQAALEAITLADGQDIVKAGLVQNVVADDEGGVRFSFTLRPSDPGTLVRGARKAAEGVSGVSSVKVNVQLPQSAPATPAAKPSGGLKPGSVPAPTPRPGLLPEVGHVVAVSSGKGGVGKSMVATNLAVALARGGLRVGLLDADIYGPNIPLMFGEDRRPQVSGPKGKELIEPLERHGVRLMSLGFLLEKEQPAIMRGPLIAGILRQFLEQVAWGPLDILIVDMPPGTGDAQLSLVQTIDLDGAVMVTTPQAVATGDVRRGIKMFERVNTRILGIVENMSGFTVPSTGETFDLFGRGGGRRLAEELGLPLLGEVPLDPAVREGGDSGTPDDRGGTGLPGGAGVMTIASARASPARGSRSRPRGR